MAKDNSSRNTTVVLEGFAPLDPSLPDSRMKDRTGQKVGKLTVLRYAGRRHIKHGTQMSWLCQCECGKLTLARSSQLASDKYLSCGCSVSEKNWKRRKSNIRHHPLYALWNNMVRRTATVVAYIARGRCDGFLEFEHFTSVMGPRPSDQHSVDRIDNDGGYWCGDCAECLKLGRMKNMRWATPETQANNKSNNHRVTYNGETHTLSEWGKITGLDRGAIAARLKLGWTVENALEIPKLGNERSNKPIHLCDETQEQCAALYASGMTLSELAVIYNSDRHSIARILKRLGVLLRNRSEWMKVGLSKRKPNGQTELF